MSKALSPAVTQAIEQIDDVGFGVIRDFVDAKRLAKLERLCEELLEPYDAPAIGGGTVTGYTFKQVFAVTRELDDLVCDPHLVAVVEHLLLNEKSGRWGVKSSGVGIKDVVPGEDIRALHRDDSIYPISSPGGPLVANSLLAIDPFTPLRGSTTFVAGSQRRDVPIEPDCETVAIEMEPGSIVIFGGKTWHGHGQNRSGQRRRCLSLFYRCGWLAGGHLSEQTVAQLSPALQRLV
jgi:ectoine hydroxylase-related dioxygenase (phytanoyl-CoA dioxygenase family)